MEIVVTNMLINMSPYCSDYIISKLLPLGASKMRQTHLLLYSLDFDFDSR